MSKLETIIYDFDGTLADTFHVIRDIVAELSHFYGFQNPTKEESEKLRSKHAKEVTRFIFGNLGAAIAFPAILIHGRVKYNQRSNSIQPYDGILDVVKELSETYNESLILSSNNKKVVRNILNRWEVSERIDEVYHSIRMLGLSALYGKHQELEKIIHERGFENSREKLIYVGDEVRDFVSCKKAGIKMIGVTWGLNNRDALLEHGLTEEYLVDNPYQLPDKIKEVTN